MSTLVSLLLAAATAFCGSATWNLNPGSGDWNTATNWTPETVPNGPADTATFDVSNTTGISLPVNFNFEVDGIVFNPGASAYSVLLDRSPLEISGVGITNDSRNTQTFMVGRFFAAGGSISFTNNATAGNLTKFINFGGDCDGGDGMISFFDSSTAGSGTFINKATGCAGENSGAATYFYNASTAANGTFINHGGGGCDFFCFVGGGYTSFEDISTAGNATLIATEGSAQGGVIFFDGDSTGGTARVEVHGNRDLSSANGNLDISDHNPPGVTIGSVEGHGTVWLGAFNLTVGSNNHDTIFTGVIQDGGIFGGTGGSLTKIGTGILTLAGANTYTGGTTIEEGRLVVNNTSGSGTGSGTVAVNAGTLGGTGTIAGAVTVASGSGAGAALAPGTRGAKAGTLTIQSALTFNSDATYNCGLNTKSAIADQVAANGVTVKSAHFSALSRGGLTLPAGTVLTVINNTATTPIAGTFANLPDGSTFTSHGNTFQASYEGGDGNDFTLTVVP